MSIVVPAIGLLVAPAVAVGVYFHAARNGWSRSRSLQWGGGVGAISLGGFLFAYAVDGVIHRLYFHQLKPIPITASPYEALALLVAVGTGISAFGVLLYGIVRRSVSFGTDEPSRR